MEHNFKTINKTVKKFAVNPTAQNFAKLTQEIGATEKELINLQKNEFEWKGQVRFLNVVQIDELLGAKKDE